MMKQLVPVAFLSCGLVVSPAEGQTGPDPFFDHADHVVPAFGLEMLLVRLNALGAFERPPPDMVAASAKMLDRDLPRFAGTLDRTDPELAARVEHRVGELLRQAETPSGGLGLAIGQARTGVLEARDLIVPAELRSDPSFAAALVAMLLLSEDGVAEAYEEVADGERWGYPDGWAALRRVREIVSQDIAPVLTTDARAEIDEMLGVLTALFPSPGPPAEVRGDPEEAEAPAHRIVAVVESAIGGSLFPDRNRGALIGLTLARVTSACGDFSSESRKLGTERIASAHFYYDEYLAGIAELFAPEAAADAVRRFDRLLLPAAEGVAVVAECQGLSEALVTLQGALGD